MLRLLVLAASLVCVAVLPGANAAGIKYDTPKSTKVVDGESVAGVHLNYKRGRVVKKLGKPGATIPGKTKTFFCDAYSNYGLAICFKRTKGHVSSAVPHSGKAKKRVKDWNGTVTTIGIANPAFTTVDNSLGIGTDLETLMNARTGTELDWGPDKYGNPPDARAYSVDDADDPGKTYWFLSGAGTAEDPSKVASFLIGLRKYMPSLSDYLDSQSPRPE